MRRNRALVWEAAENYTCAHDRQRCSGGRPSFVALGKKAWGTRVLFWCAWCSERSRQRDALSKLDDRLLNDVGITRQQANDEAAKPFWK